MLPLRCNALDTGFDGVHSRIRRATEMKGNRKALVNANNVAQVLGFFSHLNQSKRIEIKLYILSGPQNKMLLNQLTRLCVVTILYVTGLRSKIEVKVGTYIPTYLPTFPNIFNTLYT